MASLAVVYGALVHKLQLKGIRVKFRILFITLTATVLLLSAIQIGSLDVESDGIAGEIACSNGDCEIVRCS